MSFVKKTINKVMALFKLRIINANWGPRGYEPSFQHLKEMGYNPELILDIGAYDGIWTREVLPIFPQASYLLVDPLPQNKTALETLSKQHTNVSFWSGAVGRTAGTMRLNEHNDQSSFYQSSEYGGRVINVDIQTLDALVGSDTKKGCHTLLKADIQGAELDMLKGAEKTLEFCDVVFLELTIRQIYEGVPFADEVIAFLSERGFCIFDICTYSQRPKDGLLTQTDMIFVKKNSPFLGARGWG